MTGRTLAVFPRPAETLEEGETPDAWSAATEDANDLYCELNLNTTRMVDAARHMLRVPVLFVLGDTDAPRTLYLRDRYEVEYWPERVGDDTPYDLDKWPKRIDEWVEQVAAWRTRLGAMKLSAARTEAEGENPGKTTITLNDGTAQTDTVVEILDGQVTPAQMNAAIAAMGATKQNKLTFDAIPTEGSDNPVKSGGVHGAVKEVADVVAEHVGNVNIHVTAAQKTAWTAKYDKPSGGIPKSDLAEAVRASLAKADTAVQVHQSLDAYVNAAGYDSNAKEIQLKHDSTVVARIDATAFIKDGMVDSVEITGGNLVISFNTDAGVEDIEIPLTDIFNPANYYDKTAADNRFVQKETGKGLVAVDAALSTTSENPVQNKAVAAALLEKLDGAAAYPAWDQGDDYEPPAIVSHKGRLWSCQSYTVAEPGEEPLSDWLEVTIENLKQNKLSPAQMAAVNSGATAAKVAEWDGYAAQIAAKANASDVATALAQKANASDLPYAMVTLGEWEFSPSSYDGREFSIVEQAGSEVGTESYLLFLGEEQVGGVIDGGPNELGLVFEAYSVADPDNPFSVTATRASLPGHLLDRAGNRVVVTGDIELTLPAAVPGYLRDFLVRLEIIGSTVPTITFAAPTGETLTYETDGDEFPVPDEAGDWLYSFTESCVAHKFAVSLKKVNTVAQGGS